MAIQEDEDDDVDINPFTMLLPGDQSQEEEDDKALSVEDANATNQQIQHHYIPSLDSAVLIRQIRSEGLSFQLWPAAVTLVALLDRHRALPAAGPLAAALSASSDGRRFRILELGSGTGLVGIAAAATLGANVTVTDLPHVLPNLQFNADANSEFVSRHGGSVEVAALRWGEVEDMEELGREYDLILASDVVYHEHLFDPLIETLRFLLLGESEEKKKVFVMSHLKRWKKESAFFKKAKKWFEVEMIHADAASDGSRVGVLVYRFAEKLQNLKMKT